MNEQVIIKTIYSYLNSKKELNESDFKDLFSFLEEHEIHEVRNFLLSKGIRLVDKKTVNDSFNGSINNVKSEVPEEVYEENYSSDKYSYLDLKYAFELSNEELWLKWKRTGSYTPLHFLIMKNRKFLYKEVAKIQYKYNCFFEKDELFHIACIGFIKGCEHFDYTKGNKLLTYVSYWIYQELSREIINHGYAVRLPMHIWESLNKLNKVLNTNPEAEIEEILHLTGFSIDKYNELMKIRQNCLTIEYLDKTLNNTDNILILDSLSADPTEIKDMSDEEVYTDNILLVKNMQRAMCCLSSREREILLKRFGFNDEDDKIQTLEKMGEYYGVSRERVRQIIERGLNKLSATKFFKDCVEINAKSFDFNEEYAFRKNGVSYIPSMQEIINRILALSEKEVSEENMYKNFIVCAKQNGYDSFITQEEFQCKCNITKGLV